MKKIYTLLMFIITLTISAQAPQGFNYQATVRNNAGALMINKNVTFKFNVMKDTPTSVPVFSETHYVPTDDLGAVNLVIGKGTATSGTFATTDWATGTYYLGIELNTGNGFVAMGTSQLLSVPYALYASNSGNGTSIGAISTTSNPKGATITSGALSLTPADATNGGILTTGSQTIAGTKTFSSDVTVNGITVGKGAGNIFSNTVTGGSSLTANTTGYGNTVNGFSSLANNTTGNNNIAIGHSSIGNNTIGSYNIAIGNGSQRSNYNGNNNIAFGHSAGVSADNLTNTTAIGNGATVTTSNTIQLGNTNVTDVKTAGTITARAFVGDGSQLTNIANNQPWLISTSRDTLSFAKKVIIGSESNIVIPPLQIIGNNTNLTSPTALFSRALARNNVLEFSTTELGDTGIRSSIGLIGGGVANSSEKFMGIGVFNGQIWRNPLRFYIDDNSITLGADTELNPSVSGDQSTLGVYSTSIGAGSRAFGNYATAIGITATAKSFHEFALGSYNTLNSSVQTSWIPTDRLLTIGNGTSTSNRSNALVIKKSGEMSLEGNQIKNLKDPTEAQDAVTKQYVDLLQTQINNLQLQINNLQLQLTNNLITQYPVGSVFCASGPTQIVPVLNPITGRTWMDRNLGASRAATSSVDSEALGDLYQWGRKSDGHQCRNSSTTTTVSSVEQPNHGDFIVTANSSPWDWLVPQNSNLWQGVNGINNPCPTGYRIPTSAEYIAEKATWSSENFTGAYASNLKLTLAGTRGNTIFYLNGGGGYWSSTVSNGNGGSVGLNFGNYNTGSPSGAPFELNSRASGASVRCIKN